jgi:hypothetical protein
MLGLLGLRIFEATGADIADLANIACSSVVAGRLSTTSVDRVPVSATTSNLASRSGPAAGTSPGHTLARALIVPIDEAMNP